MGSVGASSNISGIVPITLFGHELSLHPPLGGASKWLIGWPSISVFNEGHVGPMNHDTDSNSISGSTPDPDFDVVRPALASEVPLAPDLAVGPSTEPDSVTVHE